MDPRPIPPARPLALTVVALVGAVRGNLQALSQSKNPNITCMTNTDTKDFRFPLLSLSFTVFLFLKRECERDRTQAQVI